MAERPQVTIYTDGGADPNPGAGGWGVILIDDASGRSRELSGGVPDSTNNQMELTAAIRALESLKKPCIVTLHTDSQYLRQGITEWIEGWIANGWQRKKGEIQNIQLWKRLYAAIQAHKIDWQWVKGHAGNRHNERADQLATQEIRAQQGGEEINVDAQAYLMVSASGGKGWWGIVIRADTMDEIIRFGEETKTTPNRLDVIAATQALRELPQSARVALYTRSDYLRNGATQWIKGWKRRDWKTKKGDPVKNRDVWEQLEAQMQVRRVTWPSTKDEEFDFIFEDVGNRLREEIESQQRMDEPEYYDD